MDRISASPQVKLGLLHSISSKIIPCPFLLMGIASIPACDKEAKIFYKVE
jgi:hypothetical protein